MQTPQYKRILLKISGEALAGDKHFGLDFEVIGNVCDAVEAMRGYGRSGGHCGRRRKFLARCRGTGPEKWNAPAPTIWACWLQ